MPSLFETIGVVSVSAGTAASYTGTAWFGPLSRIAITLLALVFYAATFLAYWRLWSKSAFSDPPTSRQNARGYFLYIAMPLSVVAVGLLVPVGVQACARAWS